MNLKEPVFKSFNKMAGISHPIIVKKRWGEEQIFINGEASNTSNTSSYCMKAIFLDPFSETSMHFHVDKHESLMVVEGILYLEYNDGVGGCGVIEVHPGEVFIVPPGFQHKLCAAESEVVIIEASTPDDPNDSIRVSM